MACTAALHPCPAAQQAELEDLGRGCPLGLASSCQRRCLAGLSRESRTVAGKAETEDVRAGKPQSQRAGEKPRLQQVYRRLLDIPGLGRSSFGHCVISNSTDQDQPHQLLDISELQSACDSTCRVS